MDNNYFKKLVENSIDVLSVIDIKGNILYESPSVKATLGYESEELVGKRAFDFIHPEDVKKALEIFGNAVVNPSVPHGYEVRFKHKNGTWVDLWVKGRVGKDDSGKLRAFLVSTNITDKKNEERKLFESTNFLNESQKIALIGSYSLDITTDVWTSSEVLDNIFGIDANYSRTVQGWLDCIHPEDKDIMDKYFHIDILKKHEQFNKEYRIIRKTDGQVRWLHGYGRLDFDSKGNPVKMIGTIQDITEQKQDQLELLQKNQVLQQSYEAMLNVLEDARLLESELNKFKLAIENTSQHIIMTDPNGIVIYANKAAELLTGFTFEEMKGHTPRLWGRQMTKEFYEHLWDTIKNKKMPFEGELTNKNKAGELYPVIARISPVLDPIGNLLFFVANERDISPDKKLADRLKKENEIVEKKVMEQTKLINEEKVRFAASINSLKVGFVMFNKEGWVMFSNRAFERVMGLEHKINDLGVIDGLTSNAFRLKEHFAECIEQGQPIEIKEIQHGEKFLHLYFAPIFAMDNSFDIIGIVLLAEDISEQKIIDRSRDEFFSIASHELRTPLTAIRGNTSLIKQYYADKLPDKDVKEMIDDINESSIRLIQIVNDFLNMSRLEMGKMTFKKEVINLPDLAGKVTKECEAITAAKKLYIKFVEPQEPIPQVVGDVIRVREVLTNLVGNAVKYTEYGGITVTLKSENNFVKVLISDTGRGISEENKGLLFRKFQQAASSIYTRDSLRGTGLGLYISKLMIEGMGGTIGLESSVVGSGSVFYLALPVSSTVS